MSTIAVPAVASKSARKGPWVNVVLIAGLAIILGLMLPKVLPSETIPEKDEPRTGAKGQVVAEYKAPTLPDTPNPQVLLGRLFMWTIVVLGLSVASIWAMRRWLPAHGSAGLVGREMKLVETLHLGNRTSLHLIHLGKREILVGADGGGIKSIVPLSRPFDDDLAEAESSDAAPETVPFIAQPNVNTPRGGFPNER